MPAAWAALRADAGYFRELRDCNGIQF